MRERLILTLSAIFAFVASLNATDVQGVNDIVKALDSIDCWKANAEFRVSLPQAADDIIYAVSLEQQKTPGDTLLPCSYVIDWVYCPESPKASGFSAYFDGHHYRYRGQGQLQEYHMGWDPTPFSPENALNGMTVKGVQRSAQFADLLPTIIALEIKEMAADSTYTLTVKKGDLQTALTAELHHRGETAMRRIYTFDANGAPLKISTENNIGQLSEQTVDVKYTPVEKPECQPLTEPQLIERWPEIFGKFRQNNFRIENLRGEMLPQIAVPFADGTGRYTHHTGDPFRRLTFFALLDPAQSFSESTIKALREGIDSATAPADLVFAFTGTSPDMAQDMAEPVRADESVVFNADAFARNCGAATLPAIIVCSPDGRVKDVVIGFNPNLPSLVISHIESQN